MPGRKRRRSDDPSSADEFVPRERPRRRLKALKSVLADLTRKGEKRRRMVEANQERDRIRKAAGGFPESSDSESENRACEVDLSCTPVDSKLNFHTAVGGLHDQLLVLRELLVLPVAYPGLFPDPDVARGVLLTGPPGCGKTLVARALAGELEARLKQKVSLFVRKGGDVTAQQVGQSELNLRMLFAAARERAPSIIFFDEVDGLAPTRNGRQDAVHSSIVTTLLSLLDGVGCRGGVYVLAATNRPESLDPALRRPGRFDKEIRLGMPCKSARREILAVQTSSWDVDSRPKGHLLDMLALRTAGFSGADLQMLGWEARANAVRRSFPEIYAIGAERLAAEDAIQDILEEDWNAALAAVRPSSKRRSVQERCFLQLPNRWLATLLSECVEQVMEEIRRRVPELRQYGGGPAVYWRNYSGAADTPVRSVLVSRDVAALDSTVALLKHKLESVRQFTLTPGDVLMDPLKSVLQIADALAHEPSETTVVWLHKPETWMPELDERLCEILNFAVESCRTARVVVIAACSESGLKNVDVRLLLSSFRSLIRLKPPSLEARRAFFQGLTDIVQQPPPLQILAEDLRSDMPRRALTAGSGGERLKARRRRDLQIERDADQHARVRVDAALHRALAEVEGITGLASSQGESLYEDLLVLPGESSLQLRVPPSSVVSSVRAIHAEAQEWLRTDQPEQEHAVASKLRLAEDHLLMRKSRIDPRLYSRAMRSWERRSSVDEDWLQDNATACATDASKCCPACGLDDFTPGKQLRCGSRGCAYPNWHKQCLDLEEEQDDELCPLCKQGAKPSKSTRSTPAPVVDEYEYYTWRRPKAEPRSVGRRLSVDDTLNPREVEALVEEASEKSEGLNVVALTSLLHQVGEATWQFRVDKDRARLISAVRRCFKDPREANWVG
eukprot:Hpha_TRINITY_DN11804_c0_g1::TRINITY_DN11804_c0_g1_i1::g.2162::m.2162